MTQAKPAAGNKTTETPNNKINGHAKLNGQQKAGRAISDPKEVAQLVMMRID